MLEAFRYTKQWGLPIYLADLEVALLRMRENAKNPVIWRYQAMSEVDGETVS